MRALLLIDIQNDFLPGGALAVHQGDQILPVVNALLKDFELVVATQDWDPADHFSFASQHEGRVPGDVIELDGLPQVLWPDHCIQGSPGAELASALHTGTISHIVTKGTDRTIDSYSGFFDNARRKATGLETLLRDHRVDQLHLAGLATDYCVKFTALDAADLGFRTLVHQDAVRGVELSAGDCAQAIEEMQAAGVELR